MRTAALEGANELVDVETEVSPYVTHVVLNVVPLKLTHHELRVELECSLSDILLGNKALEGTLGHKEVDFVESVYPIRVCGVLNTVVSHSANKWLDEDR